MFAGDTSHILTKAKEWWQSSQNSRKGDLLNRMFSENLTHLVYLFKNASANSKSNDDTQSNYETLSRSQVDFKLLDNVKLMF